MHLFPSMGRSTIRVLQMYMDSRPSHWQIQVHEEEGHICKWYTRVLEIAYGFGGPSEKNVSSH
jgi:hypothetical protein